MLCHLKRHEELISELKNERFHKTLKYNSRSEHGLWDEKETVLSPGFTTIFDTGP